jgi:thiamine-monophosphate kinase
VTRPDTTTRDAPAVASVGERELIARIRARLPPPPEWLLVGPGDDAAVVQPVRNAFDVITTDASIEGVHFDRRFVPAAAIGHRALAVNLSDLAAMGAEPRWALLSLAMPPDLLVADFDAIVDGVLALAGRHRVTVAGGNISRSPGPLMIDVTASGSVRPRRVLTRSGARPGDAVFVSGSLGAARAGLEMCQMSTNPDGTDSAELDADAPLRLRYLWAEPRVRLGLLLGRQQAASACMDLSDGLSDGVSRLAEASSVGIEIDADLVPIDDHARQWFERRGADTTLSAVAGGDDYELLFIVPARRQGRLRGVARLVKDLPLTRIGVVTKERDVVLRRAGRLEALPNGFDHFGT